MNQFRNSFAVLLLLVHYSTTIQVRTGRSCVIDDDKSLTVHNLKYNCNQKQFQKIFFNSSAGAFPPNGQLKGSILVQGLQSQNIWNGKRIKYRTGYPPNEYGTLTNVLFQRHEIFDADIYRAKAPIDGKEAFVLNYKRDRFVFFIMDYVREVQKNIYLGVVTFRPFIKVPVVYFLLEKV